MVNHNYRYRIDLIIKIVGDLCAVNGVASRQYILMFASINRLDRCAAYALTTARHFGNTEPDSVPGLSARRLSRRPVYFRRVGRAMYVLTERGQQRYDAQKAQNNRTTNT